jgi:apolipoprotein N-acyltransferase
MRSLNVGNIGLAGLSGLMLTAGFPPIDLEWIAWICFIPLLISLQDQSPSGAFKLGLIAGLSHYLTLLYWIVVALSRYGNIPFILSTATLFLLTFYLALYPAFFAVVLTRSHYVTFSSFLGASIWVVLEYVRAHILTGFPWCLLGYSQYLRLPLIQIADITGVYGISFIIILVNLVIYNVATVINTNKKGRSKIGFKRSDTGYEHNKHQRQRKTEYRHAWQVTGIEIAITFLLVGATLFYGYHNLNEVSESGTKERELRAVIAQGNIDQSIKWDKGFQEETVAIYYNLSAQAAHFRPHIIIWPETAIPFYFQDFSYLSQVVYNAAKTVNSKILFGSPAYEKENDTILYYNRAYVLSGEETFDYYDKVHLLPFGEYVPIKKYLPFLHRIAPAAGDFTPGKRLKPLEAHNLRIGALICFESIFPDISRKLALQGAEFLVNITNDAWFGRTSAPYQHLSMAALRCVETGLPMARAANTGISAFILENGEIVKRSRLFSREILTHEIKLRRHTTFYSQYGDIFVIILLIITATWSLFIVIVKKEMQLCTIPRRVKK